MKDLNKTNIQHKIKMISSITSSSSSFRFNKVYLYNISTLIIQNKFLLIYSRKKNHKSFLIN